MNAVPPEVTAIIPCRSAGERLVDAVEALRPTSDLEVVVVLNGADDATVEAAARTPATRVISSAVNRGFGGGIAFGAAAAPGRVLLLTHDDAIVADGAIDHLVETLDSTERLGAVTGSVRAIREGVATTTAYGSVVRKDGWTLPVLAPQAGTVTPVDYAGTALLAVRADAFDEIGGIDPGFFPAYYTDVDLAFRLRAAGWWIGCAPAAKADHASGSSTVLPFRTFVAARNRERFLERWGHAVARRQHVLLDDVDALLELAERDRLEALAGSAPRPRTPLAVATGDDWFVQRALAVDRAYQAHLASLERSADGELGL